MPTILVIDDETTICQLLGDVLEDAGYEVIAARNGREGVEILKTMLVDLVLCDVMMPLMDGPTFVSVLRATPQTRHIPVILMSAAATAAAATAAQRGVSFLPKPFTLPAVLAVVAQALDDRAGPALRIGEQENGTTLSA
ncbi:MAG TPA: response regulator [Herpetosiphonaceae bacterium]